MRVLFISKDLLAGHVAYLLKQEGHDVKLFIKDKKRRENLEGLVKKTDDWRQELEWVGKDGLIVFDYVGFGKLQDQLRKKGYSVFGGCEEADKLEEDRKYGQEIFKNCGLTIVPTEKFSGTNEAIEYVKKYQGPWVIKQNDHAPKDFNFVGQNEDGSDVISVLLSYESLYSKSELSPLYLQKKVEGVEIAVCRFFNGKDWVGPIELSIEHKRFYPGDLGPMTGELGTLTRYITDENNALFKATLAKMTNYLRKIDYRGVFDINSIVNAQGVFPLEATARFGNPIVHLQSDFYYHKWGDYLKRIADGEKHELRFKKGWGVVLFLVVPPFPYAEWMKKQSAKGMIINFDNISEAEMKSIHFEEVAMKKVNGKNTYYISDSRGYILYVTGIAPSIEEARQQTLDLAGKIHIPNVMYRNDIGIKYLNSDNEKLVRWGYI